MSTVETGTVDGSGSAIFSDDGRHRYLLERKLEKTIGEPVASSTILWVMLNPSLAGADEDDPTIRKVKGFSSRWGFRRILVVNLYSIITPYPDELAQLEDRNGPENDAVIERAGADADRIVVAWGQQKTPGLVGARSGRAIYLARGPSLKRLYCLGRTKEGHPRHPSRLAYATETELYY